MKIVINSDYGGFSLSHKATMRYAELKGIKLYPFKQTFEPQTYEPILNDEEAKKVWMIHYYTTPNISNDPKEADKFYWYKSFTPFNLTERSDPDLIKVVEELGTKEASGPYSKLEIVEIEPGVKFRVQEYDGYEYIEYEHTTEWCVAS